MTRQQFFEKIRWDVWYTGAMIINAGAMIPQLIKLCQAQNSGSNSDAMYWVYLLTQALSALEGVRLQRRILFYGMVASMAITVLMIRFIYYYAPAGA